MAQYFDIENHASLLNADVRHSPDVQRLVDLAERQILRVYGSHLATSAPGFDEAIRDAIAAQAWFLWHEEKSWVQAESVGPITRQTRGYSLICQEARDALRPYDRRPPRTML